MKLRFGLTAKFVGLGVGLVMLALTSALFFFQNQQKLNLELRLREKAQFIQRLYAAQIAEAMARKDDVALMQAINRLEEDKEIATVIVVDAAAEIRYHPDALKIATRMEDETVKNVLSSGEGVLENVSGPYGPSLRLVVPLKIYGSDQPMGAVWMELTKNSVSQLVRFTLERFFPFALGMALLSGALIALFFRKWVIGPLRLLREIGAGLANRAFEFPPWNRSDETGEVMEAFRDAMDRLRQDLQNQEARLAQTAQQETRAAQQIAKALAPGARILLAGRENQLLWDSEDGSSSPHRHLLDLITETNFANLLNQAFQQEGDVARGSVSLDGKMWDAAVLSLSADESSAVKTVIALKEVP